MATEIHKTAIISKKVQIADGVIIGPYCIIGDGAVIKAGSKLISNVIVEGDTEIGENCTIHPFATIGLPPRTLNTRENQQGSR